MRDLIITAGPYKFQARLDRERAPRSCEAFLKLLPFQENLLHVRWSGEATWVPLGERSLNVPPENATVYPLPGEILLYPGGVSETEILIPYGRTQFASKAGLLAGNHFMTIIAGAEQLPALGRLTLWEGAQPILISQSNE